MTAPVLRLHDDLTQRVVVLPNKAHWVDSPIAGISRQMLDRVGDEIARATSLVRYAPGSQFKTHTHPGGEEIWVLEGVLSDELGDYPAGTYIRNPPGSQHTPGSQQGCLLFVKLWQFEADDLQTLRINTRTAPWRAGVVPGLEVMPLHEHNGVNTALVRWAPHTHFNPHIHPGGEEILVLDGLFCDEWGRYPQGSWLRSPRYSRHTPYTEAQGALIYVKVGHLGAPFIPLPVQIP